MQNLKLTDLIDIRILQKVQDAFSDFTQIASLIADENGVPITEGSHFTRFCTDLTRHTRLGYERCMECDRNGGMKSVKENKPAVYQCHAGLCDFSAPIMVDGCYFGCLMGGQILTKPVDENLIRRRAAEYGINEEEYLAAAHEVMIKDENDVYRAAAFMFEFAQIISEMAYKNYKALKQSRSLEKAACNQASFIIDMNSELQKNMKNWILLGSSALESNSTEAMREVISTFITESGTFLSSIEDTVEYAKMTDGEIELTEEEYNVRETFEKLIGNVERVSAVKIETVIDEKVPQYMFGDVGRISQVVEKILNYMKGIAPDGVPVLKISCPHCSYAAELEISIGTTDTSVSSKTIYDANNMFNNKNKYITEIDPDNVGMTVTGRIVRQMHGSIRAVKNADSGFGFVISIPQLEVSAD